VVAGVIGAGGDAMADAARAAVRREDTILDIVVRAGEFEAPTLTIASTVGTFSKPKGLSVSNQFATYTVDIGAPVVLLTPTAKSLAAPAPPPLGAVGQRHLQCYRLNNVKGPAPSGIHIEDQFTAPFGGITLAVDSRGPDRLCVPVNKNGEDPTAPSD